MRENKSCIRLGLFCLTLSVVLVTPQLVYADQADERLEKVQQLMRAKKFVKANRVLQSVIISQASEPDTLAQAYLLRGVCLSQKDRNKLAQINFVRSLAINPDVDLPGSQDRKIRRAFAYAKKKAKRWGSIQLRHEPPTSVEQLVTEGLTVELLGNPYKMVRSIQVRYSTDPASKEQVLTQTVSKRSRIPSKVKLKFNKTLSAGLVEYHVLAIDKNGVRLSQLGSKEEPFVIEGDEDAVEIPTDLVAQKKKQASLKATIDAFGTHADADIVAEADDKSEEGLVGLVPISSAPKPDPKLEKLPIAVPIPEAKSKPIPQSLAASAALTIRPQAEAFTSPAPFASARSGPWYKETWVWTAVGLAVAAGAAATLAFIPERGSPPRTLGAGGISW